MIIQVPSVFMYSALRLLPHPLLQVVLALQLSVGVLRFTVRTNSFPRCLDMRHLDARYIPLPFVCGAEWYPARGPQSDR